MGSIGRHVAVAIGLGSLLVVACGDPEAGLPAENVAPPNATSPSETATAPTESSYCADVDELTGLLNDGGSVEEYNEVLNRIVDESPVGHALTWSLMLVLSEEPFSYDNFNPAVDSLERLDPDLNATCAGLQPMIVDDSGRIRSWPTD